MGCNAERYHFYDGEWAHSNCSNNLRFESEGFPGGQALTALTEILMDLLGPSRKTLR